METWEVRPGEGIGPLALGMTRAEAREAMGEDGEEGRGPDERWFARMSIRADFGPDDRVEFVEAAHEAPLRLGELDLFALDRDDVATRVAEALGAEGRWEEQGDTLKFDPPGLVFWGVNQHTGTEREFETVGVFRPGYHEEWNARQSA